MTDSKKSGNNSLRSKLLGIKLAVIEWELKVEGWYSGDNNRRLPAMAAFGGKKR
jgi:hypothetical protein